MKRILLTTALLWAAVAFAQAPASHEENAAHRMDNLAVLLDLTDSQKTSVQAVLQEEHAKMKAFHEQAQASGTRPTHEQMRSQLDQIQQETLSKLSSVLDASQLKKFQIILQERMHGGWHHHGPPPGGEAPGADSH